MNVLEFLKERGVKCEVLRHTPTYDAQHLAHSVGESGKNVAKTVLLRGKDGSYVVAVLPASKNVDLHQAKKVLGGEVTLATESELKQECQDCELGALPPFGTQYGMTTIVDVALTKARDIVFEGNRHDEAIRMQFQDFEQLEAPRIAEFAMAAS